MEIIAITISLVALCASLFAIYAVWAMGQYLKCERAVNDRDRQWQERLENQLSAKKADYEKLGEVLSEKYGNKKTQVGA